jgi:hypothetical protein
VFAVCTTLSCVKRKARKQHTCIWCGEKIERGEKYIDHRVVNDEANCVDTQHWHLECEEDFKEALRYEGGGCMYFSAYEATRPHVPNYVI